jgi:hypothetical protein
VDNWWPSKILNISNKRELLLFFSYIIPVAVVVVGFKASCLDEESSIAPWFSKKNINKRICLCLLI